MDSWMGVPSRGYAITDRDKPDVGRKANWDRAQNHRSIVSSPVTHAPGSLEQVMCVMSVLDDEGLLKCWSCEMTFTLIWDRNPAYTAIEYCPFCGQEVEEVLQ